MAPAARERRPPVGHGWPQASGRRIAAPPHGAARQRHRHSRRWHRPPGNADAAPPHGAARWRPVGTAGRRPAGGASLLPRMTPQGKDTAIRADGTGRQGTPTSGRQFSASAPPHGARHSWPQASGRRIAAPPHDAAGWRQPPFAQDGTTGRQGTPVSSPVRDTGIAGRRPAGGASLLPGMTPRGGDSAIRADSPSRRGTPTSGELLGIQKGPEPARRIQPANRKPKTTVSTVSRTPSAPQISRISLSCASTLTAITSFNPWISAAIASNFRSRSAPASAKASSFRPYSAPASIRASSSGRIRRRPQSGRPVSDRTQRRSRSRRPASGRVRRTGAGCPPRSAAPSQRRFPKPWIQPARPQYRRPTGSAPASTSARKRAPSGAPNR